MILDDENNIPPENQTGEEPQNEAQEGANIEPDANIPDLNEQVETPPEGDIAFSEEELLADALNNEESKTAAEEMQAEISASKHDAAELEAVYDVPVQISAVLGRATMPVHNLLKLGRGAVVELDRRIGEAIDIYVNNMLVARGEVVVVDDRLGITMTEIIKTRISGK